MKNNLLTLILLLLLFPYFGFSQDCSVNELHYEVNRVYPPLSITKEKLNEANILLDLNPDYKSSWINTYISVEILTVYKGGVKKAVSKNNTLSQEQKENMNRADLGTDISVIVHYIPENNLKHNDVQKLDFSFTLIPANEAKYIGGQQEMRHYFKRNGIDEIPEGSFKGYDLAAVKFGINEKGEVVDPHVFWPSKNEKIDKLLLETVCNMSNWTPASYMEGKKVKQEFVLTVGNMENCAIHLLNIDKN